MIQKRNARKEVLDITKLQKMTIEARANLDAVSQRKLELDAEIKFIEGMSSSDIQDALIKTAVEKLDIDVHNIIGKTLRDMCSLDIKNLLLKFMYKKIKEEKQKLHKQIIKNLKQIKLIKIQLINQIICIFNNSYFNIFLFNIIGNNSSEKPHN
ncbi:ATP cone domain-containing protein [Aliarcobacter butzleri]|uniref:ATP cone domain-containing protein n=1 Tax=Aliarcobacter butzleri TaxID=28197 RepID=UPI00116483DE|nr:ATP cone domain-containing protein [Aliarcobacter butzleri]MCP3649879.1 ATP cone domain-containing protein [Arcobacter sp. DNRA7]MCG3669921.1 hypothetical protein [Aliarcobacter butzleri]MCR1816052.1 ATP cone domain-containing protein [Aliarcobacter butzleri]MDH1976728.1 ATP cone domain-containing protein [Aliarcobacter butzleri]QDM01924.1 hypothetical protein FM022_09250 [Aliarcobacter butzleri]